MRFCALSLLTFNVKSIVRFAAALGMVEYSDPLKAVMSALFPPKVIKSGMGEIMALAGLKQLRIAETEKYPHVSFFFNGGREEPIRGRRAHHDPFAQSCDLRS